MLGLPIKEGGIGSHQKSRQATVTIKPHGSIRGAGVEYFEKPSNKLFNLAELDSDTWVGEVKRIRGKKQPLSAAEPQQLKPYRRPMSNGDAVEG